MQFRNWLTKRAIAIAVPVVVIGTLVVVLAVWGPRHPPEEGTGHAMAHDQAHLEQRARLETETVQYRELSKEIRTVGKLDYNERRVAVITVRVAGRVDRVYADFTGIRVKPRDHLVSIYSPDLYSAQAELLIALRAAEQAGGDGKTSTALAEAVRTKLLLLGILPEQLKEIEETRKTTTHLTIYAPIGGVIIEKNIREQQYVAEGDIMYRIADLDPLWLYLDIYEYDLGWIRYGQQVDVSVEAYPDRKFQGTIVFIDPFLNEATRTIKVRVNMKNPDLLLKPGMYASALISVRLDPDGRPVATGLEGKFICPMHPEEVQNAEGRCGICDMPLQRVPDLFPAPPGVGRPRIAAPAPKQKPGQVLAVPATAVLDTGRRQIAYRKRDDSAFELVELKLGKRAEQRDESGRVTGQYFPVFDGLKPGDEVVVRGGFLLDSERQIEGLPTLLYAEGRSAASLHAGHGGHAAPKTGHEGHSQKSATPSEHAGHKQ